MNTTETVLIVGASTRAAAFSARRAGLKPRCLDYFVDRDLMAICTVDRVEAQEGVAGLERLALGLPPGPGSTPVHSKIIPIGSSESREPINCTATRPRPCVAHAILFVWSKCCAGRGFLTSRPGLTHRGFPAMDPGWSNRSLRQEVVSSSTWITRRFLSPSRATFSNSSMARAILRCSSLSKKALLSSLARPANCWVRPDHRLRIGGTSAPASFRRP